MKKLFLLCVFPLSAWASDCEVAPGFEALCEPSPPQNITFEPKEEQKLGRISGFIYNEDRWLGGVEVRLTSTLLQEPRRAYSCYDGFYSFGNLVPGTYQVTLQHPNAKEKVQDTIELESETILLFWQVQLPQSQANEPIASTPECLDHPARAEVDQSMGAFMKLHSIESWHILRSTPSSDPSPQSSAFLQKLPTQSQRVSEIVAKLPNVEVSGGLLSIYKRPADLMRDGLREPFPSMKALAKPSNY